MARTTAWRSAALAAVAAVAFACKEQITAPGHCPELCPGDSLVVVDTVLTGIVTTDTSFRGFTRIDFAPLLMVANTDSVEAHPLLRYPPLPQFWFAGTAADTVHLGTIDSVALDIQLNNRDTSVNNTRLLLYRIPVTTKLDSLTTFDSVSAIWAGAPFDSIPIADSLRLATLRRLLPLASITPVQADSFVVQLGLAIRGDSQTIARLLAGDLTGAPPTLRFYVHGAAPRDTFHTVLALTPEFDSYVQNPEPQAPASGIVVGNQTAARSFIRFDIPRYFVDSVNVVRATLLLTPTRAVRGIPGEVTGLIAQPILRYFDGKSVLLQDTSVSGRGSVTVGQTGVVEVEMARVLRLWRGIEPDSLPRAISVRNEIEEFTTVQLDAAGRTAGATAPRLHISFIRPFKFGVP